MRSNAEGFAFAAVGFILGGLFVASLLKPRIQRLEEEINTLRTEHQELTRIYYTYQARNQFEHSQLLQRIQLLQNRIAQLEAEKQIEQIKAINR